MKAHSIPLQLFREVATDISGLGPGILTSGSSYLPRLPVLMDSDIACGVRTRLQQRDCDGFAPYFPESRTGEDKTLCVDSLLSGAFDAPTRGV